MTHEGSPQRRPRSLEELIERNRRVIEDARAHEHRLNARLAQSNETAVRARAVLQRAGLLRD